MVSNPGLTCRTSTKLRSSRPAPVVSATASATSATTSAERARRRRWEPAEPRLLSWSAACALTLAELIDGSSPTSTPVRSVASIATPSTGPSMETSAMRGRSGGASATSRRTPQNRTTSPASPPAMARSTLSVRSWRARSRRLAPSAVRVASSFSRAMLRASMRFATFTEAMIRTPAMPAKRISSAARMGPTV